MEYKAFKEEVFKKLQKICGGSAQIKTEKILKNNGKHYDGIQIFLDGADEGTCPAIPLQWFFGAYCDGDISLAGCAKVIYAMSKEYRDMGGILEMLQKIKDWEYVKESIYPILLSTKDNQEMLERVVSLPMLDLSVAYIFRGKIGSQYAGIKISYQMLEVYGINAEKLHQQALKNLADDGYCFHDVKRFVMERICGALNGKSQQEGEKEDDFYIYTNGTEFYGAAGILDRERVREFANGRSFYILPASIHETIFVSADGSKDVAFYNDIIKEVNERDLGIEERLSDHAYFYDARMDEIRMCA